MVIRLVFCVIYLCLVSGYLIKSSVTSFKSSTCLNLFNKFGGNSNKNSIATKTTIPKETLDNAYEIWNNANDFLPESAPSYLSSRDVHIKFSQISNILKSPEQALILINNDPTVFSFSIDRIKESYEAWCEKLESEEKALMLVQMNPPILALSEKNVLEAGPDLIAQTYFWSYYAVATRPLGKAILQLLKPLKKSMMSRQK